MGVEASYRRITPAEWERVHRLAFGENALAGVALEKAYLEFAYSDELMSSNRYFSVDKDWHALHVLLTGDTSNPSEIQPFPPPLGNVVIGGTETPIDATYGKVRFLTPDEVREVADALEKISTEELMSRFDPEAFNEAKVYPNPRPGGWDSDQLESLEYYYPKLVAFFREAAREGDVVLLSFD
jgi:hypothetical protein